MSLLNQVIENSVYHYSEGDTLYIPVSDKTKPLIENYEHKNNVKEFYCPKSNMTWYEIRFANDKFWEDKINKIRQNVCFDL
jgi:hypothetical protein